MARVLIPLAKGFEELEAITLIDLLRRADIEVVTAGLREGPVTGSRGIIIVPDATLDAVLEHSFNMIVLPGGLPGADNLDKDQRIHTILKRLASTGQYTAAICAAPKVLARAGLLDGRTATCYPGCLNSFPRIDVVPAPVVTDGKVITSRGPGTAIDFTLTLIEILAGRAMRDTVEDQLQRETD